MIANPSYLDITKCTMIIDYFLSDCYLNDNRNMLNSFKNTDIHSSSDIENHVKVYSVNEYIKRLLVEILRQGQPAISALGLNYKKANKSSIGLTIANFNVSNITFSNDLPSVIILDKDIPLNPKVMFHNHYKLNGITETPIEMELPIPYEIYKGLLDINNFLLSVDGKNFAKVLGLKGRSPRDLYVLIHYDDNVLVTEKFTPSVENKLERECLTVIEKQFDIILENKLLQLDFGIKPLLNSKSLKI